MTGALPEFILLTGGLGSGKTTLLSDYLSAACTDDTGVIVNDAGEINVDGATIRADSRDLSIATLSNGCICCSMGNSVQEGIDALLLARAQDRLGPLSKIILETSGLAEPGPILRSLRQVRQTDFRVRIVATFDASAIDHDENFLPHYAAQLAAAQVIVVTKLDMVQQVHKQDRVKLAASFNPTASVIANDIRIERARAAFDREITSMPVTVSLFEAVEVGATPIRTALARWDRQASWNDIGEWIENISGYLGSRLLRMKGIVHPNGFPNPVLVNGVGGVFSPPRPIRKVENEQLGLMMILRDIDPVEFYQSAALGGPLELRFK